MTPHPEVNIPDEDVYEGLAREAYRQYLQDNINTRD